MTDPVRSVLAAIVVDELAAPATTPVLAIAEAARARHEYVTLEHLLSALIDDRRTSHALVACGADLRKLRRQLEEFLSEQVPALPDDVEVPPQQTLSVERVLRRAAIHVMSSEQEAMDGTAVRVHSDV